MLKTVAACTMLALVLALIPAAGFAQSLDGSIYQVQTPPGGAAIYLIFSISGSSFIVGILTYGSGGNGRWFGAMGTTTPNGLSGTGQIIFPSGFALTQPPNSTFHFDLAANGASGTFSTTGLSSFLSAPSGSFSRVF